MANQSQEVSLYGGAITARLPKHYMDVSDLRQVPDNQEVYVERDGLDSVVFDITVRVEGDQEDGVHIATNLQALKYHAEDIVETTSPEISSISTVTVPHLPANISCMTCFVSSPATDAGSYTGMLLLLMRLADRKTDLLVTLNLPELNIATDATVTDQSKLSARLQSARLLVDEIVASFEIKDWGLFAEEEQ